MRLYGFFSCSHPSSILPFEKQAARARLGKTAASTHKAAAAAANAASDEAV
jgi:hypothetical protein